MMGDVAFFIIWFSIEAVVLYLVGWDAGYHAKERENTSLFHPEYGWVNVKTFNTIEDAQEWIDKAKEEKR
jgi:hypothetical protein